MIDRKSLKYLLNAVKNYNERTEKATISVEFSVTYTVAEEVKVEEDEEADESTDDSTDESTEENTSEEDEDSKTETVYVTYTEDRYMDVVVSNDHYNRNYIMDWQTIYIMCLLNSINNYDNWIPGGISYDEDGNEIEIEPEKLSKKDIDNIVNDFKPSFIYYHNVVSGPKSYTKDEVLAVPHTNYTATEEIGGTTYYIEGNIPKSELSMVVASYFIDFYSAGNISTYSLENTFINKANNYYKGFDLSQFMALMHSLPGGEDVANTYNYIFNLVKWEE